MPWSSLTRTWLGRGALAATCGLLTPLASSADEPGRSVGSPGEAAAWAAAVGLPEPLPTAGLTTREEMEAFVDGFVGAELEANPFAGLTVAVVKDGALFFAKGYGYADVSRAVPVDADRTLFRPGSVSKLLTWTAVMHLAEQGKLDLDADVNAYLTQFKIPATYPSPITLRHALTHSVGLEDGGVGYLMARSPQELVPLARSLADHLPVRVRPVGGGRQGLLSSYSNWATALAGLIVANVSGLPFEDYVQVNLLAPLGMQSSTFREPLPEPLAERMSHGYTFEQGTFKAHGYEFIGNFGPAGALAGTATDMARFMNAHLGGGPDGTRVLRPETLRAMHARALSPHAGVNGSGLGFYETYMNGRRIIGHGGDTIYFHSELGLLEEERVGFFVSVNTGGQAAYVPRHFVRAFMNHYFPARLPILEPVKGFAARAGKYTGRYRALRHSHSRFEKVFALFGETSVAATPDERLLISALPPPARSGPLVLSEVAPDLFRDVSTDTTVAFVVDGAERVVGMVGPFAFIPFYKLRWFESAPFHLTLVALCLLLFLVCTASALRNWRKDKAEPAPARWARRSLGSVAALHLAFVVGFASVIAAGLDDLAFALPKGFLIVMTLPLVALVLTPVALILCVAVWRNGYWTRRRRLFHSAGVLGAMAFVWFLNYWNLIGYQFRQRF